MTFAKVVGQVHRVDRDEVDTGGPPDNFVDSTVYRYKIIEGEKVLIGTQEAFPTGYDQHNNNIKSRLEDEVDVAQGRIATPSEQELRVAMEGCNRIADMAVKFGVSNTTMRKWLIAYGLNTQFALQSIDQGGRPTDNQIAEHPAAVSPDECPAEVNEPSGQLRNPVEVCGSELQEIAIDIDVKNNQVHIIRGELTLDDMKVIWIADIMDNCVTAAAKLAYIKAVMEISL